MKGLLGEKQFTGLALELGSVLFPELSAAQAYVGCPKTYGGLEIIVKAITFNLMAYVL
jgi:hypothetical protein